jgi:hypothetical protein
VDDAFFRAKREMRNEQQQGRNGRSELGNQKKKKKKKKSEMQT